MTWNELREKWPDIPETSAGWHQHTNGGWVSDDCTVDSASHISDSIVEACSVVTGSRVEACSVITGSTVVGSTVEADSLVTISQVAGSAHIRGLHTRSPLWIQGTRYSIGYHSPGMIASGCITQPLAWWLLNVERCAEEHGYTVLQQQEYRLHVEHIAAWMRLYGYQDAPGTTPRTEGAAEADDHG